MSRTAVICISIFLVVAGKVYPQSNGNLGNTKITVKFAATPGAVTVIKTPLKYNKLFAFSAQLDDGAPDIYTHALPFLHGGTIGGVTYPGLSYTDGCGKNINFNMSSSCFSFDNTEKIDVHDPASGYSANFYTWPQACEMYKAGWGISNHGMSANDSNFEYSVERNHSNIKLKTQAATTEGINMGIFVNPDGDTSFTIYALQNGYRVAYREGYGFGNPSFDVTSNWTHGFLRMGRTNFVPGVYISNIADNMAAASTGGKHHWGVVFSHAVTNGQWGYDFNTFVSQMTSIYNKYGKVGADNIWMTIEEEVLDYLLLSPYLTVNTSATGNNLIISFSGDLPTNFRFYSVSLLVSAGAIVESVSITGPGAITYNGAGTKNSLINLTWDKPSLLPDTIDPAVKDANTWVSKTETSPSQKNANVAVDYVNILPAGPEKNAFKSRLCAIAGITYPTGFCVAGIDDKSFGRTDIWPNPANEDISFRSDVIINSFTMLNTYGQQVVSCIIGSREATINLSSLKPGIYLIKLEAGDKTLVRRITIM